MPLHFLAGGGGIPGALASLLETAKTATSVSVELVLTSGSLVSWTLERSSDAGATWTTVATGLTGSTRTVAGLSPETPYLFRASDIVAQSSVPVATVAVTTEEAAGLIIQRADILPPTPMNGMFLDQEPIESGVDDIPAISGAGRTICGNYNRVAAASRSGQYTAYGVRLLLGNLTTSPISGGKIILGLTYGWNGNWTPRAVDGTELNVVTDDIATGWARASIGGDFTLPIPGADPASPLPTRCAWTDWVPLPGINLGLANWDILTRCLLPPRSVAPYALTHGEWSEILYQRIGTLAGRNNLRAEFYAGAGAGEPTEFYLRAEGDYVTDPGAAGNIVAVAGECPNGDFPLNSYGPPGPGHTPILGIQYATSMEEMA